jgi:prolyl-tRNA synthetase
MVIKPNGYALWEKVQENLGRMIKETGHRNVYFPIFIPKSLLNKEAEHIEGFAKESAVVTHHRVKLDENKKLIVDPESKLDEELILRPTSESIMYDSFSKWINSYRDLPLLLNQWSNIIRWEMRTRIFLRTSEFLWQEGHTAHATQAEAEEEALKMLNVYKTFIEEYLAIPVKVGRKSESEKFPGALHTYTVEAMMQDGKALQCGTSHNLGDNFAKAFNITYLDKNNQTQYVWQTSWGSSTRLIGGMIMTHADENGLVLPPKMAEKQVVLIPIWKTEEEKNEVLKIIKEVESKIQGEGITTHIDERDYVTPGFKFNEWEKQGIPVRVEIGPKDIEKGSLIVVRRDTSEKTEIKIQDAEKNIKTLLDTIQSDMFTKAKNFIEENTKVVNTYEEFKEFFKTNKGFVKVHWDESEEVESQIKEETGATSRCLLKEDSEGKCFVTGKSTKQEWLFGIAY